MHISTSEVIRLIARAIGANFKFFDPAYQYYVIQNPRILIINAIKIKNSIDLNVQRIIRISSQRKKDRPNQIYTFVVESGQIPLYRISNARNRGSHKAITRTLHTDVRPFAHVPTKRFHGNNRVLTFNKPLGHK